MVDQNNDQSAQTDPTPSEDYRRGLRGTFVLALVAVALLAGITGNLLSKAFGQGNSWQHISWHDGGFSGGLSPAQVDDRIDRMTKHIAVELDATAEQQAKLATIAKAAVADLRPLQEKARAARAQAVTLLTAPTIDRSAIRALARGEHRTCGNGKQTHRAGAGGCRRRAQPRTAPEGRGVGGIQPTVVGALASRLTATSCDEEPWANASS